MGNKHSTNKSKKAVKPTAENDTINTKKGTPNTKRKKKMKQNRSKTEAKAALNDMSKKSVDNLKGFDFVKNHKSSGIVTKKCSDIPAPAA